MQHKYCVEAVDRTLRDICDTDKSFGGITVVLGGDFRQCLPVIPKGLREQIVQASLTKSYVWSSTIVLQLIQNMRMDHSCDANIDFAKFLAEIGTSPDNVARLPPTMNYCDSLDKLIEATYPNLAQSSTSDKGYFTDRNILAARNDDVNTINSIALNIFPGVTTSFLAADKIDSDEANGTSNTNQYPNEYLNSLNPPGLPPFSLNLKVGCPIMLLRNIAPKYGLCNGTRLQVECCTSRCIKAIILTGDRTGESVFIPRISLTPSSTEFPFQLTRRQFPVRLAFAMTINKSQGQSIKYVGIDLRNDVFSHGQLYVALSRCTSANRINMLLPKISSRTTTNIVYPEALI